MKHIYSLVAILLLGSALPLKAALCTAIVDGGNWNSASTWSCGHVPGNNDTMWIPVGYDVTVSFNSPTYANMLVIVDGTLNFDNGSKLNICPGSVYISSTGLMGGGTPGSKLNICGTTMWNGPEYVGGPTSFGPVVLPVELLSFTANVNAQGQAVLNWSTATETNNSHFTLERSADGVSFTEVGRVAGSGTVSQIMNYTFTDNSPEQGISYYRLKQTDYNGQFAYKGIVAVNVEDNRPNCNVTVVPNPCQENCAVTFSGCSDDDAVAMTVQVINSTGQVVSEQIVQRNAQGNFTASISDDLTPGMYTVRGALKDAVYTQRFIVQ